MLSSTIRGLAALAAIATTAAVGAQDYTQPPSFGSVRLNAGFLPDPHVRNLTAGGAIRAADAVSSSCRGYIANAPDYSVYYTAGSAPLFLSVDSDRDTTLVVNGPDGRWYCDDDGGDEPLNPLLSWSNPQSGRYDIWVGTYSSGSGAPATLYVSEIGEFTRETAYSGGVSSAAGVDISAPAIYGNFSLNGGFLPDPWQRNLTAGGTIRAANAVSSTCRGYITNAPSFQMSYNGSGPLYIYTEGSTDTTLVVNGPDGRWHCNDDEIGTDAGLAFHSGVSGVYDIYVGTYGSSRANTTLRVSEISMGYAPGGKSNDAE